MNVFEAILSAICALESAGIVTLFLFYKSRAKGEQAKADTASEEAVHASLENKGYEYELENNRFKALEETCKWMTSRISALQCGVTQAQREVVRAQKKILIMREIVLKLRLENVTLKVRLQESEGITVDSLDIENLLKELDEDDEEENVNTTQEQDTNN